MVEARVRMIGEAAQELGLYNFALLKRAAEKSLNCPMSMTCDISAHVLIMRVFDRTCSRSRSVVARNTVLSIKPLSISYTSAILELV